MLLSWEMLLTMLRSRYPALKLGVVSKCPRSYSFQPLLELERRLFLSPVMCSVCLSFGVVLCLRLISFCRRMTFSTCLVNLIILRAPMGLLIFGDQRNKYFCLRKKM